MGVQGSRGCWETGSYSDSPSQFAPSEVNVPQEANPPVAGKKNNYHIWIRWVTDNPGCEVEIPFSDETSVYQLKRKIAARSRRPVRAEVLKLAFPTELGIRSEIDSNTKIVANILPIELLQEPDKFVLLVQDPDYEDPAVLRSRLLDRDRQNAAYVKQRAIDMAQRTTDEEEDDELEHLDHFELEVGQSNDAKSDSDEASSPKKTSYGSDLGKGSIVPEDREDREENSPTEENKTEWERKSLDRPPSTGTSSQTEEIEENTEELSGGNSREWLISLKQQGFLVNKYTWNKGTRRQRVFFLDPGDNGRGGIDYSNAVIYWVKKKSKNPIKDKRQNRMIYLKEITTVTPGKTTNTFDQGEAQAALEERCLSIHFKALTRKPKPREKSDSDSGAGGAGGGGGDGDEEMIEVPRTLDLEVDSKEMRERIVKFINSFIKKARKHSKKFKQQDFVRQNSNRGGYDGESDGGGGGGRRERGSREDREEKIRKRPQPLQPITSSSSSAVSSTQQPLSSLSQSSASTPPISPKKPNQPTQQREKSQPREKPQQEAAQGRRGNSSRSPASGKKDLRGKKLT